jgi:hypothetical protein
MPGARSHDNLTDIQSFALERSDPNGLSLPAKLRRAHVQLEQNGAELLDKPIASLTVKVSTCG